MMSLFYIIGLSLLLLPFLYGLCAAAFWIMNAIATGIRIMVRGIHGKA